MRLHQAPTLNRKSEADEKDLSFALRLEILVSSRCFQYSSDVVYFFPRRRCLLLVRCLYTVNATSQNLDTFLKIVYVLVT